MSAHPSFLGIPLELRLAIYNIYLIEHQRIRHKRQPSNEHFRLLHVCRQLYYEGGPLFRRYISLRHERQINAFILHANDSHAAQVQWADVANDGRVFYSPRRTQEARPLSSLHLALRRMTALNHLRVFQCRQGIPIILPRLNSTGIAISFENAMYPDGCRHRLASYELFVDSETRVSAFEAISPQSVEVLRLSGDCRLPATPWTPALRQVTLYGITGNYFDQHAVDECFPGARLESFMYGLGHRLGFEIRNRHLESLAAISGPNLRKLVLLGCSRLSSAVIAACLQNLPSLEHLALGLVTVDELRTNFILALPPTISVFMLQIMNAWYAVALLTEERSLCEAIEGTVLLRTVPPRHACLNFRDRLMNEAGRRQRWEEIARNRHFDLDIGPWESSYLEEL